MIWANDNPSKSTKSLRSVSILKLRKILERIDTVEVLFNANRYILQLSEDVYCDYLACLDWLKDKRVRTQPDFEYFYDYICNSTVDVLSRFIDTYSIEDEADRVIQIADQILLNDPCNEEALLYKIKALIYQNNFKLARYVYDRFCALYQEMYGEAHWQDCAIAIVTPVPSLWQDRATVMACLCHPCGTPLPLQWQMYAPH